MTRQMRPGMQGFRSPQQNAPGEPSQAGVPLLPHVAGQYPESSPMYNRPALPKVVTDDVYYSHDAESISPREGPSVMVDGLRPGAMGSNTPSPGQMSAHMMMMQNPKRAYRQRRKDPSCDACRERKVKVSIKRCHDCGIVSDCSSAMPPRCPAVQNVQAGMYDVSSPRTPIDACPPSSTCFLPR